MEDMQAHGVPNMPDPDSKGNFLLKGGEMNGVANVDVRSSQYQAADKTCSHLLPDGVSMTAAEQQQAIESVLKFVACLRIHGLPDMPDPVVSGGNIELRGPPNESLNSPKFQAAQKACASLSPAARA